MNDSFKFLQEWFLSNCDYDWEHGASIKITTLDNPGWAVDIELEDTIWENKPFKPLQRNMESDDDWATCFVEDKKFKGRGGPLNLEEILRIFKRFIES